MEEKLGGDGSASELEALAGANTARVLGGGWGPGPGTGAPLTAPALSGLLRVSGDCHRCDRHPALRLPSLLQPVHPVVFSEQECPFL